MIVPRTSREEILNKLGSKVDARKPIMIASADSGLVAKLLEKAGVDCINTFSGARLRANGMGTMSMMWPSSTPTGRFSTTPNRTSCRRSPATRSCAPVSTPTTRCAT